MLQYCETKGKGNTKHKNFFWILFMSLFTDKSMKTNDLFGISEVSNCHGWNIKLENPPTHKLRDDVSCGNFGIDATSYCNRVLIKSELFICLPISYRYTNFIWTAFNVPMLDFFSLLTVVLGSIGKIISFSNLYLLYFKCDKLIQMFRIYFYFAFYFSIKTQGSL